MATSTKYKSKFFSDLELSCRCGCGLMPKEATIRFADQVRGEWGKPILCLSGARCEKHNAKEGGAPNSAHLYGLALDLAPADRKRIKEFQDWCASKLFEWKVVGMEDPRYSTTWCHLQLRPPYKVFSP